MAIWAMLQFFSFVLSIFLYLRARSQFWRVLNGLWAILAFLGFYLALVLGG